MHTEIEPEILCEQRSQQFNQKMSEVSQLSTIEDINQYYIYQLMQEHEASLPGVQTQQVLMKMVDLNRNHPTLNLHQLELLAKATLKEQEQAKANRSGAQQQGIQVQGMPTNQVPPASRFSSITSSYSASSLVGSAPWQAQVSQPRQGQLTNPTQGPRNQQILPNSSFRHAFQHQGSYQFGQDDMMTFGQQQSAVNLGRLSVPVNPAITSMSRPNISFTYRQPPIQGTGIKDFKKKCIEESTRGAVKISEDLSLSIHEPKTEEQLRNIVGSSSSDSAHETCQCGIPSDVKSGCLNNNSQNEQRDKESRPE